MSHTPGPWRIVDDEHPETADATYHHINAGDGFTDEDHVGFQIAGFFSLDDARLIAAAPEMAEMLDNLWHFLDAQAKATQNGGARFHISSLAADVKKLLAKATGGAQ